MLTDFGDSVSAGSSTKAAAGDDWADFASARSESKLRHDASPDDFIEGLTKLTFTKSYKPEENKNSDFLDEFADFTTAAPTSASSVLPQATFSAPFGMPHSMTMPTIGPRPPIAGHSVTSFPQAAPAMFNLPQSQSMQFGQPMMTTPPTARPMGVSGPFQTQSVANFANYHINTAVENQLQIRPTVRGPNPVVIPSGKTAANWGTGGLNIDLDLSLAKQYSKPLSPSMNQLQHQQLSANASVMAPQVQSFAAFGAQPVGSSPWPAQTSGSQTGFGINTASQSASSQHPFGDLL